MSLCVFACVRSCVCACVRVYASVMCKAPGARSLNAEDGALQEFSFISDIIIVIIIDNFVLITWKEGRETKLKENKNQ